MLRASNLVIKVRSVVKSIMGSLGEIMEKCNWIIMRINYPKMWIKRWKKSWTNLWIKLLTATQNNDNIKVLDTKRVF